MKTFLIIIGSIILIVISVRLFIAYHPVFGGKAKGGDLDRILKSNNFKDGEFLNSEPTDVMSGEGSMIKAMWEWIVGPENGKPDILETKPFILSDFQETTDSSFNMTWFGHSSVLLKLSGKNILIDPVFSKYASPIIGFNGSFNYSNKYSAEDMPNIDILIISHDHYDHLDKPTIENLDSKVGKYFVPLGVKAHLTRWGVDGDKVIELDWWEEANYEDEIKLIATPARHFSGRGTTRNNTLWCSWVITSEDVNIFFGGDSGYGQHFMEIGDKYGPFELTMIECGQYNERWKSIHAMPEESVQAHVDLKGVMMLPIHNSKFQLALHSWTDPIERARKSAEELGINLLEPKVGEVVEIPIN